LELTPWRVGLKPGWDIHFRKFDSNTQLMIMKKLDQMAQPLAGRGLHSCRYQVEEIGQYRIAFECNESTRTKSIHFVGNHKQYEKWYKSQV